MKIRQLSFNGTYDSSKLRFNLMYQGFVTGGNIVERKNMQTVRLEAQILDLLDAVSEPTQIDIMRQLKENNGEVIDITLSEQQFQLLRQYIESTPWRTTVSRQAVDLCDWLMAIPQTEA